jgi:hypothetical protein
MIKGNPNGFHAIVTMIFRAWTVCLAVSGSVSPGPSNKFVIDGLGGGSLHREKQAD